jgi:hypothetical protein
MTLEAGGTWRGVTRIEEEVGMTAMRSIYVKNEGLFYPNLRKRRGEGARVKRNGQITKPFLPIIMLLLIPIFFSGCAATERWREEVQLGDGRIIIIERELLREGGGDEIAVNRSGTKPKEHRLRFAHPDKPTQEAEWRSTKFYKGSWPEKPLFLDLESGKLTVFAEVGIGPAEAMYSKYVFRNGSWQEEKLPDIFPARNPNLYMKTGSDMPSYVDLEKKSKDPHRYHRRSLKLIGPKRIVIEN